MDLILDPTIMFFCLGVIAVWVKSNIEIPRPTMKFLSYYLLMSIGFKGGISIAKLQFTSDVYWTLFFGLLAAFVIPIWVFYVLKRRLAAKDAAAAAACFGSVSAVTFLTATSWLENRGIVFGGHMVALMALMESPAIIIGLILAKTQKSSADSAPLPRFDLRQILHEAFFNGSVFILLGSLAIGALMNPQKASDYQVFVYDIFKGFLCFFLLDLGMAAARQVKDLRSNAIYLASVSILAPLVNATAGLFIARWIGLDIGNGFLFIVLLASASYIAVPAALKTNLPEANPTIYLSMALGLAFPFNILLGLPIYWWFCTHYL